MSGLVAGMLQGDRWIPWTFVAFFLVVFAANGALVWVAMSTWPGLETSNAYERGLAYNQDLAAAEEQAALGWQVDLAFEQERGTLRGLVRVDLADRLGNLLRGAAVEARFVRPTSEGRDLALTLEDQLGGRYQAEVELPLAGQWDVHVTAHHGGHSYRLRERVFVEP